MLTELFRRFRTEGYTYPLESCGQLPYKEAFERLYKAFAPYEVSMPMCDTCFPNAENLYRQFLSIKSIKDADQSIIQTLYWDSPCCGGASNWKRFFPRMLQAGLWTYRDVDLFDRAVGAGMWAWPAAEQVAIRDVLAKSFVDWVVGNDSEPLGYRAEKAEIGSPHYIRKYERLDNVGFVLLTGLLLCRVDPESVIVWLLSTDNTNARKLLSRMISKGFYFWGWGLDADEPGGIKKYGDACRLLAVATVGEEKLIQWYMEAEGNVENQSQFNRAANQFHHWSIFVDSPSDTDYFEWFVKAFNNSYIRYESTMKTPQC